MNLNEALDTYLKSLVEATGDNVKFSNKPEELSNSDLCKELKPLVYKFYTSRDLSERQVANQIFDYMMNHPSDFPTFMRWKELEQPNYGAKKICRGITKYIDYLRTYMGLEPPSITKYKQRISADEEAQHIRELLRNIRLSELIEWIIDSPEIKEKFLAKFDR